MPRLSALRLSVLNDLASQLRYAPKKRTIEQLGRAIELAAELDASQLYPEEWLIQRITGYRPDIDEPAVVVGEALRRDLSAFTEHVSEHAGLDSESIEMSFLSLGDLESRWSVSARTIERYRRAGLIALRVRDNGRTRLVFPLDSVEAYERTHTREIASAGAVTRLSVSDRDRLVRLANRARRRFGWSLNEVARRIAEREHRSHEGVRQTLLKAGGAKTAIARQDRVRRVALRASRAGATVSRLAEKYEKSPATIRRILRQERAATLRNGIAQLGIQRDQLMRAFDEQALEADIVRSGLQWPVATTAGEFVEAAKNTAPPSREVERAINAAQRALLTRIVAIGADESATPTTESLDRAETDARWVTRLIAKLVRMQWLFILNAIEARVDRPLLELPAGPLRSLHATALDAAAESAWRFNSSKGGRLAAVTGIAVDRAVVSWMNRQAQDLPTTGGRAKAAGATLSDWTQRLAPWQPWIEYPPQMLHGMDRLTELERAVMVRRWGAEGDAPMTIQDIADQLAVTVRRVGAVERTALRRIRETSPR